MMMSAKMKNGAIGSFWGIIGFIILFIVIAIPSYNNYTIRRTSSFMSRDNLEILSHTQREMSRPIMIEQQLSPRVIVMSSDSINSSMYDISFTLNERYFPSIDLFKTKSIKFKDNPEKEFKIFITDLGLTINENGDIIDITNNVVSNDVIMCHVIGFFPNKPYIKPNCGS